MTKDHVYSGPRDERAFDDAMLPLEWVCKCMRSQLFTHHGQAQAEEFMMDSLRMAPMQHMPEDDEKFNGIVERIKGLIRKSDFFPDWSRGRFGSKFLMSLRKMSKANQPKPKAASSSSSSKEIQLETPVRKAPAPVRSKRTSAAASAPQPAPGDKGYLHKATKNKYRRELEKQQRRIGNERKGVMLTDAEWSLRFQALVDYMPHLQVNDQKAAEEQLTKFKDAAQVSGRTVTVQWPQP
jgi:hypothetical protein